MDLLAFEPEPLYFDEPLAAELCERLERAAACYGSDEADQLLREAQRAAPTHLTVLVALYRNHFYRHRLPEAEAIGWQAIAAIAARTGLPGPARLATHQIGATELHAAAAQSMTLLRFYLSSVKAIALIKLRGGELTAAIALFETLCQADAADRLGGRALLGIARTRHEELGAVPDAPQSAS